MMISAAFSLIFSALLSLPSAKAVVVASEAELRNNCETKKEASACFSTAFTELHKGEPTSRKTAAKLLMRACALQKKKSSCSKNEAKVAAKNYLSRDRVPAAISAGKPVTVVNGVKTIKAPKIPNPAKSTPSTYTPPAFEPAQNQAPTLPFEQSQMPMAEAVPYIPPPPPMPPPMSPPDGSFSTEPAPQ